ncbi:MAG: carboxypeptidase regulatory-like domain-containing protein, partial [Sphingobacteriaceae bacterium]|nr:carboxypeptidase regulatory-like domain-containing protein [Cytophagaceae bacterium]
MEKLCFFFLSVTTLLVGRASAQPAPTVTLTGRITDAATGQPLPFATVYIDNTTQGTLADAHGMYRLTGVALGTVELAASFVGYHPARQALRLTDSRPHSVSLALKPDAALLQAVIVTAQKPKAWQRQFRQFKAALLGDTYFAGQCSIPNGRMVEFSEKDGHLLATASEPLMIENAALGYRLHYELLHFDLYQSATYYAGISRFEELKPETPAQATRWHRARQRAYEGSTRHLLASLLAGTHERQGFLVYRATFVLPTRTQGAVLRSESQPGARVVRSDTLFRPGELPFERELVLSTCLEIFNTRQYTRNSPYPALPYAYSVLYLPQGRAGLTTSGWVSNPDGMEIRGFLGGDRLATLLPADWQPEGTVAPGATLAKASNYPEPAPDAWLDSLARRHAERPGGDLIFLHPTKPAYTTGDRLWLSAYVLDPATHQPRSSRIDPNGTEQAPALQVELLTPTGHLVLHQWQPVSKGRASGTFRLSDSLATGTYRLRAYSGANREAQQPEFERTIFVQNGVSPPEAPPDSAQPNRLDVQFLPEGGRWVAGLPARLGLKVLDRSGRGLRATAVILDAQNGEVARLTTNSLGMGSLELTPLPGQRYHALVRWGVFSQTTSLPAPEPEGLTLRAEAPGDSAWIRLRLRASARYDRQAVYVLAQSRGRVHWQQKRLLENGTAQVEIPTGSLPAGVCQIALFDAIGRPWAERLVFIPEKLPPASLSLTAGKPRYQARERAAFSLRLLDGDGLPLAVSGSVSVTDANQVPADSLSADLRSYLLLTSGLRGRVENPNAYLHDTQPGTLRALDDLLLTQGWRRMLLPMNQADSLGGLVLRGRVLDRRGRPLPLANVILTSTSASQPVAFSARADSAGNFRISGLLLRDTVRFRPRVMDNFFKTLDATARLDAPGGR